MISLKMSGENSSFNGDEVAFQKALGSQNKGWLANYG